MSILSARLRKQKGKKVKSLRRQNILPAVLYGPKIESLPLEVDLKDFENVYQEAGQSSLVALKADGKEFLVLIHETAKDPLTGKFLHADFYQPSLEEEVEATVPIIFEGEAPAVKELGGTLVKVVSEVQIKALPQKLLKEIKVPVTSLKTFDDRILIKDLVISQAVRVLKEPDEIVAYVAPVEKVEEELEKPIEEKVEEVAQVERKEKEEETKE